MSEQETFVHAGTSHASAADERRASIRYRCHHWVRYRPQPVEQHEQCWARARDLSVGGVGMLTNRHLTAQTALVIEFRSPTSQACFTLSARVAHATRDGAGNWVIGCAFDQPLSEEELDALL
jgi:hypothetical protein